MNIFEVLLSAALIFVGFKLCIFAWDIYKSLDEDIKEHDKKITDDYGRRKE